MPIQINQYIFRFEISIHYIGLMKLLNAKQYLAEVEASDRLGKLSVLGDKKEEFSSCAKFKNKVEVVFLYIGDNLLGKLTD